MAFIDMGDQFLALSAGGGDREPDAARHFGLVVNDKAGVREALEREGIEILGGRGLNFRDPWGNLFQIVDYREIQFERSAGVKQALGIDGLEKTAEAKREIAEKGIAS
jgi:hypothetical protein